MAESEIIIPSDMLRLIKEQQSLHREYAASLELLKQLEQLKDQLPERGNAQTLSPLTQAGTPVSELTAVLPQLKQRLAQIARLEAEIQQQEHTLLTMRESHPLPYAPRSQSFVPKTEESKSRALVVGVAVLVLILLLFLLFVFLLH